MAVTPSTAMADLLAGPLPIEREHGLTSALPKGAVDGQVRLDGGIATVPLTAAVLDSGRTDQVLALAQVVLTLDDLPEVRAIRFVRDGNPLVVPRSDGSLVPGPVTSKDYQDLLR